MPLDEASDVGSHTAKNLHRCAFFLGLTALNRKPLSSSRDKPLSLESIQTISLGRRVVLSDLSTVNATLPRGFQECPMITPFCGFTHVGEVVQENEKYVMIRFLRHFTPEGNAKGEDENSYDIITPTCYSSSTSSNPKPDYLICDNPVLADQKDSCSFEKYPDRVNKIETLSETLFQLLPSNNIDIAELDSSSHISPKPDFLNYDNEVLLSKNIPGGSPELPNISEGISTSDFFSDIPIKSADDKCCLSVHQEPIDSNVSKQVLFDEQSLSTSVLSQKNLIKRELDCVKLPSLKKSFVPESSEVALPFLTLSPYFISSSSSKYQKSVFTLKDQVISSCHAADISTERKLVEKDFSNLNCSSSDQKTDFSRFLGFDSSSSLKRISPRALITLKDQIHRPYFGSMSPFDEVVILTIPKSCCETLTSCILTECGEWSDFSAAVNSQRYLDAAAHVEQAIKKVIEILSKAFLFYPEQIENIISPFFPEISGRTGCQLPKIFIAPPFKSNFQSLSHETKVMQKPAFASNISENRQLMRQKDGDISSLNNNIANQPSLLRLTLADNTDLPNVCIDDTNMPSCQYRKIDDFLFDSPDAHYFLNEYSSQPLSDSTVRGVDAFNAHTDEHSTRKTATASRSCAPLSANDNQYYLSSRKKNMSRQPCHELSMENIRLNQINCHFSLDSPNTSPRKRDSSISHFSTNCSDSGMFPFSSTANTDKSVALFPHDEELRIFSRSLNYFPIISRDECRPYAIMSAQHFYPSSNRSGTRSTSLATKGLFKSLNLPTSAGANGWLTLSAEPGSFSYSSCNEIHPNGRSHSAESVKWKYYIVSSNGNREMSKNTASLISLGKNKSPILRCSESFLRESHILMSSCDSVLEDFKITSWLDNFSQHQSAGHSSHDRLIPRVNVSNDVGGFSFDGPECSQPSSQFRSKAAQSLSTANLPHFDTLYGDLSSCNGRARENHWSPRRTNDSRPGDNDAYLSSDNLKAEDTGLFLKPWIERHLSLRCLSSISVTENIGELSSLWTICSMLYCYAGDFIQGIKYSLTSLIYDPSDVTNYIWVIRCLLADGCIESAIRLCGMCHIRSNVLTSSFFTSFLEVRLLDFQLSVALGETIYDMLLAKTVPYSPNTINSEFPWLCSQVSANEYDANHHSLDDSFRLPRTNTSSLPGKSGLLNDQTDDERMQCKPNYTEITLDPSQPYFSSSLRNLCINQSGSLGFTNMNLPKFAEMGSPHGLPFKDNFLLPLTVMVKYKGWLNQPLVFSSRRIRCITKKNRSVGEPVLSDFMAIMIPSLRCMRRSSLPYTNKRHLDDISLSSKSHVTYSQACLDADSNNKKPFFSHSDEETLTNDNIPINYENFASPTANPEFFFQGKDTDSISSSDTKNIDSESHMQSLPCCWYCGFPLIDKIKILQYVSGHISSLEHIVRQKLPSRLPISCKGSNCSAVYCGKRCQQLAFDSFHFLECDASYGCCTSMPQEKCSVSEVDFVVRRDSIQPKVLKEPSITIDNPIRVFSKELDLASRLDSAKLLNAYELIDAIQKQTSEFWHFVISWGKIPLSNFEPKTLPSISEAYQVMLQHSMLLCLRVLTTILGLFLPYLLLLDNLCDGSNSGSAMHLNLDDPNFQHDIYVFPLHESYIKNNLRPYELPKKLNKSVDNQEDKLLENAARKEFRKFKIGRSNGATARPRKDIIRNIIGRLYRKGVTPEFHLSVWKDYQEMLIAEEVLQHLGIPFFTDLSFFSQSLTDDISSSFSEIRNWLSNYSNLAGEAIIDSHKNANHDRKGLNTELNSAFQICNAAIFLLLSNIYTLVSNSSAKNITIEVSDIPVADVRSTLFTARRRREDPAFLRKQVDELLKSCYQPSSFSRKLSSNAQKKSSSINESPLSALHHSFTQTSKWTIANLLRFLRTRWFTEQLWDLSFTGNVVIPRSGLAASVGRFIPEYLVEKWENFCAGYATSIVVALAPSSSLLVDHSAGEWMNISTHNCESSESLNSSALLLKNLLMKSVDNSGLVPQSKDPSSCFSDSEISNNGSDMSCELLLYLSRSTLLSQVNKLIEKVKMKMWCTRFLEEGDECLQLENQWLKLLENVSYICSKLKMLNSLSASSDSSRSQASELSLSSTDCIDLFCYYLKNGETLSDINFKIDEFPEVQMECNKVQEVCYPFMRGNLEINIYYDQQVIPSSRHFQLQARTLIHPNEALRWSI